MAEQVAVVDACATTELSHRVPELGRDERVHHDRGPPSSLLHGDVEVVDVLDAGVPDLLERLIRELGLEREHEALRRLARRVRDDVELDRHAVAVVAAHGRRLAPESSYDQPSSTEGGTSGIRRAEGSGRASCGATGRTSASRTRSATSTTRRRASGSEAGERSLDAATGTGAVAILAARAVRTSSGMDTRSRAHRHARDGPPRKASTVAVRGRLTPKR